MDEKSKIEKDFHVWLNAALGRTLPFGIVAFNFNIYEGSDPTYHIQLIGASRYEKDDPDWACHDIFTTGENIFFVPRSLAEKEWQKGHAFTVNLVREYLNTGRFKDVLLSKQAVGVGFVDGDVELVWEKPKEKER